jgi:hypothetical protein
MVQPITVNEAIENLATLAGQDVSIVGEFSFHFEDVSLSHLPKSERRDGYRSSIWIGTGSGALRFDLRACKQLSGKQVVVEGMLFSPVQGFGGCGHMSLWPAEMLARSLEAG